MPSSSASRRDSGFRPTRPAPHWAVRCALCSRKGRTPPPGAAGTRRSRCCCTSIRSTSNANAPGARSLTASGFPAAGPFRPDHRRRRRFARIATTGIAAALAKHAGSSLRTLPSQLRDALSDAGSADSIVVALDHALDVPLIERAWAVPARDALAAGSLHAVTLLCDDAGDAIVWYAPRPGVWQRVAGRYARHDLAALLGIADQDH